MKERRLTAFFLAGLLAILGPLATAAAAAPDDDDDDAAEAAEAGAPGAGEEDAEAAEAEDAEEEESSWSFEFGYDYSNIYLFRGVDLLDSSPVDVGHASVGYGGWAGYWYGYYGNVGIDPYGTNYLENDFGVDYTWSLMDDKFSLTAGAVAYTYENDSARATYEVYGIAGWDVPFQPSLSIWWDVDEYDGGYAQLAVAHSFDLGLSEPMALSIDIMGGVGFDYKYNNDESTGNTNDLLFGLDIPWTINEHFSAHAGAQKSFALPGLEHIGQGDEFVYTLGAGFSW